MTTKPKKGRYEKRWFAWHPMFGPLGMSYRTRMSAALEAAQANEELGPGHKERRFYLVPVHERHRAERARSGRKGK